MQGADEVGLEVSKQLVYPAEMRQVTGVVPTADDGFMAAARDGEAEAGQTIG